MPLAFDTQRIVPSTTDEKSVMPRRLAPRQKNRRIQGFLAGWVILLILGSGAYWVTRNAAPTHYTTAPVTRGTVACAVSASGTVNPILTIIVG
jgi:HlyD family secretion protein